MVDIDPTVSMTSWKTSSDTSHMTWKRVSSPWQRRPLQSQASSGSWNYHISSDGLVSYKLTMTAILWSILSMASLTWSKANRNPHNTKVSPNKSLYLYPIKVISPSVICIFKLFRISLRKNGELPFGWVCTMWYVGAVTTLSNECSKNKKILQKKLSKFYFFPKVKSTAKFSYSNNKKIL